MEKVKISAIKSNPDNPRIIKDDKFKKLVKSIKGFPQMLELRPIVVNNDMVVLGGNMRLKACKEAGLTEVPIIKASELTPDQEKEFIVKDNVGFGEWDWDILANEWDADLLEEWGLDGFPFDKDVEEYTSKVDSPIYDTKNIKPKESDLYNLDKYNQLIKEIENLNLTKEEDLFLKLSAGRHIEFSYSKIADYYAHSNSEVQELMENSALVIIDYEKAIEKGFVDLHRTIKILSDTDG
tara:strand:- start:6352 stop:7065 length:714 start_codon:yes stop_codon:yes gene_type:complete